MSHANESTDSDDEVSVEEEKKKSKVSLSQPEIFYPTLGGGDADGEQGPQVCEECERKKIEWYCAERQCLMALCDMCFDVLHRKGKRSSHAKIAPGKGSGSPSILNTSKKNGSFI